MVASGIGLKLLQAGLPPSAVKAWASGPRSAMRRGGAIDALLLVGGSGGTGSGGIGALRLEQEEEKEAAGSEEEKWTSEVEAAEEEAAAELLASLRLSSIICSMVRGSFVRALLGGAASGAGAAERVGKLARPCGCAAPDCAAPSLSTKRGVGATLRSKTPFAILVVTCTRT